MAKDKPSTADILAKLRKESGGKKAEDSAAPAEESPPAAGESPPAEDAPAEAPQPKPAGDKPKSTSDILAALRAEGKGGAKPAPAAGTAKPAGKPAAPKKAAATGAAPAAGGAKPSVQEMLKAVREGKRPAEPAAVEKPKPERKKPAAKAAKEEPVSRRSLLAAILMAPLALVSNPFAAAWTALVAATGAFTLGMARFMMPNVLVEPPSKFKVGPPDDYPYGTVSTKWKAQFGVWVVHTEYEGKNLIYALASICTHLGCTPNWLEGEQKFKCPCHGSGFYITGVNFEGPAPRPLERYGIRVAPDGMVEIDKSVKFQQELGQWANTSSFVEIS